MQNARNDHGGMMVELNGGGKSLELATMSADFERALTREVLRTELIRTRTLIVTGFIVFLFLAAMNLFYPEVLDLLWHGEFGPVYLYAIAISFILFEVWSYASIGRNLERDRDLHPVQRYIGAFVETSMPTVILMLQVQAMGSVQALGYVMPLAYFIFVILSTLRLDFWLSAFTGFVAAAELFAVAMYFHPAVNLDEPELYYNATRSLIIVTGGVLAGGVGTQLRRQFAASVKAATARDRITNLFGQHVSPQVVEQLMTEEASTAGEVRRVAVMFADFRGFTAAARSRSPREVFERLDSAFAVLVEIVDRHGGIVNKFLGDGFLALFGAPLEASDPAQRAVAAGREMLAAMERINTQSNWPLRIGIGINFGEAAAGCIGSPRRKEYTVIGDTVNFASRLEQLNKELGSQLLISEAVRAALGSSASDAVSRGEVEVRGYERPVAVWQLG